MATETPSIPRLRKLLLKFYQENDPVVLQKGFDISGLVTFTHEKGIDVVNRMLFKKYGKAIDVNAELGTAKQEFNRMSQALTTSTKIQAKEHEYRTKLYNYFKIHNPTLTQPGNSKQLETLVQFALLNGLQKLSNKLYSKYKAHIEGINEGDEQKRDSIEMDVNQGIEMEGGNKFELDVERLKSDLEAFYTEMEDEEQLEVLDEMADWACEIGIEEFDKKLLQLYGQSLNGFNQEVGKPLHFNKKPEETVAEPETPPRFDRGVPPLPNTSLEPEYETVPGIERPFEDMSDEDLKDELVAFYEKHDPDNLAKLEKVMDIARRMGRDGLNEQLMQIYEATLEPLPTKRLVKPTARPVPAPVPRALPNERGAPPPKFGVGISGNVMAEMSHAVRDQPPGRSAAEIEAEQKKRREEEAEAKRLAAMPEFMRKALMTKKRNQAGTSLVTGADGKKVTVNILIAVCKNYKADPINGVCKNCEFAIGDHFYGFKKKEHF